MDAVSARNPDPDDAFNAVVAGLDEASLEAGAAACELPLDESPPAGRLTPAASPQLQPVRRPEAPIPATRPAMEVTAPPKPPELRIPPQPQRNTDGVVNWWARAFPHIVWLSVAAGLAGQVFGFAEFFGGGAVAWVVACLLGGTFEFMMVACSSRGLRAIGLARSRREVAPFLVLGTLAAGFAAFMNVQHFAGWLGMAAGAVSLLGYFAHVFSHLYDELDYRTVLTAWKREKAAVEAQLRSREDAERAEYDAYQAELSRQRRRMLADVVSPKPVPEPVAEPVKNTPAQVRPARKVSATKPTGPVRATKDDAIRMGVETGANTPAVLRGKLVRAGYTLPSSSTTIENWCREIKKQQQGGTR